MKSSPNNGVMIHPLTEGMYIGFYVENANDDFLPKYIDENFKQVVGDSTNVEALERLAPVKQAIETKGYTTGPFEVKSHKDWCVDVLGADPDEYDANRQAELDAQVEYDEE